MLLNQCNLHPDHIYQGNPAFERHFLLGRLLVFSSTQIEYIFIPSKVYKICEYAYSSLAKKH